VDNDPRGIVAPLDVLITINYINLIGFELPPDPIPPAKPEFYYDVDGDGAVTPRDVLDIINILNDPARRIGEGEAAAWAVLETPARSATVASPQTPTVIADSRAAADEFQRLDAWSAPRQQDSLAALFRAFGADPDADLAWWLDDLPSVLAATA
jgi:hypothetical protein